MLGPDHNYYHNRLSNYANTQMATQDHFCGTVLTLDKCSRAMSFKGISFGSNIGHFVQGSGTV